MGGILLCPPEDKMTRKKRILSEEHKCKVSEGLKRAYKEGKRSRFVSDEKKQKISQTLKQKYTNGELKPYAHWTGKKMSDWIKQKMSESARQSVNSGRFKKGHISKHAGKKRPELSGKNHWNWKGGITTEIRRRVTDSTWKRLRKQIYQRDNWRCGICGIHCRESIQCHHILPVAEGGTDNRNNLITLCKPHHLKIERSQLQEFWRHYLGKKIKTSLN